MNRKPANIIGEEEALQEFGKLFQGLSSSILKNEPFEKELIFLQGSAGFGKTCWLDSWEKILQGDREQSRLIPFRYSLLADESNSDNFRNFYQGLIEKSPLPWQTIFSLASKNDFKEYESAYLAKYFSKFRGWPKSKESILKKLLAGREIINPDEREYITQRGVPEFLLTTARLDTMLAQIISLVRVFNFTDYAPVFLWEIKGTISKNHEFDLAIQALYDSLTEKKLKFLWIIAGQNAQVTSLAITKLGRRQKTIPLKGVQSVEDVQHFIDYRRQENRDLPIFKSEVAELLFDQLNTREKSWKSLHKWWNDINQKLPRTSSGEIGLDELALTLRINRAIYKIKQSLKARLSSPKDEEYLAKLDHIYRQTHPESEIRQNLCKGIECLFIEDYLTAFEFVSLAVKDILKSLVKFEANIDIQNKGAYIYMLIRSKGKYVDLPEFPANLPEKVQQLFDMYDRPIKYTPELEEWAKQGVESALDYLKQLLPCYESLPE